MRKHGKHAQRRTRRRLGVAAALGGATALAAVFPGSPAHASPLPSPSGGPALDAAVASPDPGAEFDKPRPPAPAVVTAAAVNPAKYVIKSGDTLGAIAAEFCGSAGKYPNLAGANHISDPDLIIAGAVLDAAKRACEHAPAVYRPPVTAAVVTSTGSQSSGSQQHSAAPAPQPQYHATYAGTLSYGQLEQLWVSAGGPAWAESHAAEIATCESGGRTNAYNPSGATGLWQILGSVVAGNLDDPYVNALNAVSKFKASGDTFAQWVCQ